MTGLRERFLLRPGLIYLNHGAQGACPRPVFEQYQSLQLEALAVDSYAGHCHKWPSSQSHKALGADRPAGDQELKSKGQGEALGNRSERP
jgi:hypothetical protein